MVVAARPVLASTSLARSAPLPLLLPISLHQRPSPSGQQTPGGPWATASRPAHATCLRGRGRGCAGALGRAALLRRGAAGCRAVARALTRAPCSLTRAPRTPPTLTAPGLAHHPGSPPSRLNTPLMPCCALHSAHTHAAAAARAWVDEVLYPLLAAHLQVEVAAVADVVVLLRSGCSGRRAVEGCTHSRAAPKPASSSGSAAPPRLRARPATLRCLMYRMVLHLSHRVHSPLLLSTGLAGLGSDAAVTGSDAGTLPRFTTIGPSSGSCGACGRAHARVGMRACAWGTAHAPLCTRACASSERACVRG